MKINCNFILEYPNSEIAGKIRDSLEVDNYKYIMTKIDGNVLTSSINSDSFLSLLHTIEDYLSCLITAESLLIGPTNDND